MKKSAIPIKVKSSLLDFDRHNPRLVQINDLQGSSDEEIVCALVADADIGELLDSIVANRYMDIEPLIVTKKDVASPERYRVLEGNRRLCAIYLLRNPDVAKKCRISLPENVSPDVFDSFDEITVIEMANEVDSRAFIGFKHINGAHRWDSFAKAKFLTKWYLEEFDGGITIEDIARQLGDNNQTVRNLVSGMLALQQAEEHGLFDINDRTKPGPFGFSHIYTALSRKEFRNYLGLDRDWDQIPQPVPIALENEEKFKDVLQFIYGSKSNGIESVVKSQNPHLKQLGEVLTHPVAIGVLMAEGDLKVAYEEVSEASAVFSEALIIASMRASEALKKTSKFDAIKDGDTLLPAAKTLLEDAGSIVLLMENKILRAK